MSSKGWRARAWMRSHLCCGRASGPMPCSTHMSPRTRLPFTDPCVRVDRHKTMASHGLVLQARSRLSVLWLESASPEILQACRAETYASAVNFSMKACGDHRDVRVLPTRSEPPQPLTPELSSGTYPYVKSLIFNQDKEVCLHRRAHRNPSSASHSPIVSRKAGSCCCVRGCRQLVEVKRPPTLHPTLPLCSTLQVTAMAVKDPCLGVSWKTICACVYTTMETAGE